MDPHVVELPRRIAVGRGVIDGLDKDFSDLALSGRPLILVDENTRGIAGDRVAESLKGLDPKVEVVTDSSTEEVSRVEGLARDFSTIVSAGGGRIIDVGKAAAFRANVPFIAVPTAPSHDGIASEGASLTGPDGKVSVKARPPLAVIADITVLMEAPGRLISAGAADIIANLTSVRDWELARDYGEYYSEYAAGLARRAAGIVMESAVRIGERDERGIRNLMEAIFTSSISMSMAGSSRPASGAEHSFSHVLEELGSKAYHGEQCGVGSIMMGYLQGIDWRQIRKALSAVKAPTTAGELGISDEVLLDALVRARDQRDRYTILNTHPLDRKRAEEIALITGVISGKHDQKASQA